MSDLSDVEERVLSVLEQRSQLDLEQVASASRLHPDITQRTLDALVDRQLVSKSPGKFGPLYQLNRRNIAKLTAVA